MTLNVSNHNVRLLANHFLGPQVYCKGFRIQQTAFIIHVSQFSNGGGGGGVR